MILTQFCVFYKKSKSSTSQIWCKLCILNFSSHVDRWSSKFTWGGINLEDIKAPESFKIEKALKEHADAFGVREKVNRTPEKKTRQ